MRVFLMVAAVIAAALFLAVSAVMNMMFLASLGKGEHEAQVFAAVSLATDAMKVLLPVFMGWAWASGRRGFAVCAAPFFVVALAAGLFSAVGFAVTNREATAGGKLSVKAEYATALSDLAARDAKLKELGTVRPSSVVGDELSVMEQDRRFQRSARCANATLRDSQDYCRRYFELKGQRSTAIETEKLAGEIEDLKRKVSSLRAAGADQETDGQARLVAEFLSVGEDKIRTGLAIFVGVLVELFAAFGFYLATGHGVGRPRPVKPRTVAAPKGIKDSTILVRRMKRALMGPMRVRLEDAA